MSLSLTTLYSRIKNLSQTDNVLRVLCRIEEFLDQQGTFGFKNWDDGELVEGPKFEKYFITTTWMWNYEQMPDPRGGERLLPFNTLVSYKVDYLEYPIKVKSEDDYQPKTKVPKIKKRKVWLVELVIPRDVLKLDLELYPVIPEELEDEEDQSTDMGMPVEPTEEEV